MEGLKVFDVNLIVYINPSMSNKVWHTILTQLSSLLFTYDEVFEGVLLAYEVHVRSKAAGILPGLVPYYGAKLRAALLFFSPKTDMLIDTMTKFASLETIVEQLYNNVIPTPKEQCSKSFQLGVSFVGGLHCWNFYVVVSHPADNLVSFLNNAKGATVGDTVKKLRLLGLFTCGLPLRIVMIGTLTGAQWGIYDAFKLFVGLYESVQNPSVKAGIDLTSIPGLVPNSEGEDDTFCGGHDTTFLE